MERVDELIISTQDNFQLNRFTATGGTKKIHRARDSNELATWCILKVKWSLFAASEQDLIIKLE